MSALGDPLGAPTAYIDDDWSTIVSGEWFAAQANEKKAGESSENHFLNKPEVHRTHLDGYRHHLVHIPPNHNRQAFVPIARPKVYLFDSLGASII